MHNSIVSSTNEQEQVLLVGAKNKVLWQLQYALKKTVMETG
jgi:hypothetical protein